MEANSSADVPSGSGPPARPDDEPTVAAAEPAAPASRIAAASAAAARLGASMADRARPTVQAAHATVGRAIHSAEAQRLAEGVGHLAQEAATQTVAATRVARAGAGTVARTAGTHAGVVARSGASATMGFLIGLGYFWVGLGRFLRSPRLWFLAAVPATIVVFILASIQVGSFFLAGELSHRLSQFTESWPGYLQMGVHGIVDFTMDRMTDVVGAFLVLPLSVVVGAPFYVFAARSIERRLGEPAVAARPGVFRASGFAILQSVRVTLIASLGWALLLPLMLLPFANVAAALAVVVLVDGFLVGLLTLAIPLHHRGIEGFRNHLRYAWQHRSYVIGFGVASMLVLAVPFWPLRWLTAPVVFVGAVLLYRCIERRHAIEVPQLEPSS